jgi:hypothetical protein
MLKEIFNTEASITAKPFVGDLWVLHSIETKGFVSVVIIFGEQVPAIFEFFKRIGLDSTTAYVVL